ncbi:MAG: preQ(1) synthase [Oscillospiraceae bacterium]|nr:preQ(1) synthase [Oscillospiraceae bacterium]
MSNNFRKMSDLSGLTLLGGGESKYTGKYTPGILETFPNSHPDADYMVRFDCPEFTTLCPLTGQPDFGSIRINYIPEQCLVESKSLKLYLFSFRNHGGFHEDCVNVILKDLRELMKPKYIEVEGNFMPRGGISIHPYVNWGIPQTHYQEMAWNRMRNFGI